MQSIHALRLPAQVRHRLEIGLIVCFLVSPSVFPSSLTATGLLRQEREIIQNDLQAQEASASQAERALEMGRQAFNDASSQGNAQAESIAQQAIQLARQVLEKSQSLRASDEGQLRDLNAEIASQPPEAPGGLVKNTLRARLRSLEGELAGLQEALRRLNQSAELNASQRELWLSISNDAAADAWKQGIGMATDGFGKFTIDRLNQGIKDVDNDLAEAVTELSGETDPGRRERLHSAIKLLEGQKSSLESAVTTVGRARQGETAFSEGANAVDWSSTSPHKLEQVAQVALGAAQTTLSDPGVQKALSLSPALSDAAQVGKSMVGSGYDIVAETVSIKQLKALNAGSDSYLAAVKNVQEQMKSTVSRIKTIQSELGEAEASQ